MPAGAEPGCGRRSGDSLGVAVAVALSWAVSHAEGRVTPSIRNAFTPATYEFTTHTTERYLNSDTRRLAEAMKRATGGRAQESVPIRSH